MIPALVIYARILLHSEKISDFKHSVLLQDLKIVLLGEANVRLFPVYLNRRKELDKAFIEPRLNRCVGISVQQLVCIFVEDHGPWIFHRHVQQDETTIRIALKKSGDLRRLSVIQRRELPQ